MHIARLESSSVFKTFDARGEQSRKSKANSVEGKLAFRTEIGHNRRQNSVSILS